MIEPEPDYLIQQRLVKRVGAEHLGLNASMRAAIDEIAPRISGQVRATLEAIDYHAERDRLNAWFSDLLRREPPGPEIVAFSFGYFDGIVGFFRKSSAPVMYAAGADRFEPLDAYCEWACGPAWFPRRRYAPSSALRTIGRVCPNRGDLIGSLLAGVFVAAAAIEALTAADPNLVLSGRRWRAIGTGHDAGDHHVLGYITADGFINSVKPPIV